MPRPNRSDVPLPPAPGVLVADAPGELERPQPPTVGFHGNAKEGHGTSRTGVLLPGSWRPPDLIEGPGRRPVIAILDTPISTTHPWLGDGVAATSSWRSAGASTEPTPWEQPDLTFERAGGGLASHHGHGTFIAGIVRQLAPGARILSLPVMNEGGVAETGAVNGALDWLLTRVRRARDDHQPDPDLFVDVVNLSFGWYGDKDASAIAEQRSLLHELGEAGVRVVASAGNRTTDHPVFPAAFATDGPEPATPLLSVGALDPNGALAAYTNFGDWVKLYGPGTGLISTVPPISEPLDWPPTDVPLDAGGCPIKVPNPNHESRGFARWGGTSFAAAWVSAVLAQHLLDEDLLADPPAAGLSDLGLPATHARAAAALAAATGPGSRIRSEQPDVPG